MNKTDLLEMMEFSRKKTLEMLDSLEKRPDGSALLAWRPGPGRAHIGWQLMHIAATDDRHLNVRMKSGTARDAELVRRFAGGSVPDDVVPGMGDIRRYLTICRQEMLEHLRALDDKALDSKPNAQAPWTYREWIKVLFWHEAHHQGQAHLTLNLYKAAHEKDMGKAGQ